MSQRNRTMMMGSSRRCLLTVLALFFLCLFNDPYWHVAAVTTQSDYNALNALHSFWSRPYSNLPDWPGTDPCGSNWVGVTCDDSGVHVTQLSLSEVNLTGGIPAAIGDLTSLASLDLSYNGQLGGPIPPELGKLVSLQILSLMFCGLTGGIPDALTQLVNLTSLSLNGNNLSGTIPPTIGYLNYLTWLDISENQLSGSLPIATSTSVGLDNLTSCQHFHFYSNSLSGNIPPEIFNPPHLVHILLYANSFQGSIPGTTLSNAVKLKILSFDNNDLGGQLPPQLNQLTGLSQLTMSNNHFIGTLPDLTGLSLLVQLDVSNNPFDSQEIPRWVYLLNNAQTITMNAANLTGNVNPALFSLPNLQQLSLSNNALNGTFSMSSPSVTNITIDLQDNQLTGTVGTKFGNATVLLAGNPFCSNFGNSGICAPQMTGPSPWSAPSGQGTCGGGQESNPNRDNNCAYPLICYMQLTAPTFQVVNNIIITTLSDNWAKALDLDPSQVYITAANFSDDHRLLYNMSLFPLSGDSLNPSYIQNILHNMTENSYNISEGPYVLRSFTLPLLGTNNNASKIATGAIIGIVVAAIVALLIFVLIGAYAIRQKKRADKAETSRPFASWGTMTKESGDAPQLKGARWFSLAELRKATNNWSDDNAIGAGGYGTVYKAELPGGAVVAVKRADEGSVQGAMEFKTEIELLSRVHHRNLVGLVGFCYEHGEQALVYEYMPNGTLRDHLLGHFEFPLTWDMRVAIALGSARGLTYLHELANPPIIHRDIKSGNILLDDKMVAKVADFGLSKLAPEDAGQKGHLSTQVKGTLGYLDPEYYMTNQLSEKSDVYSFGVVLMEMLSARPPIERGRYIVREVRTALDKGGIKALEPLLDPFIGEYPPKQLEAFLDLALLCVDEVAAGRPTMNEVVKKLEVIAGSRLPSSGVHITVEPQKADDIYGKDHLQKISDPSFQYSGASFTAHARVEPK